MSASETAMADQLAAANTHLQDAMDALVIDGGYQPGTAAADPWLLALLVESVSDTCEHVAAMRSPAPVFITARLRRMECQTCHRRSAEATTGTLEDATCDRCRTLAPDGLLMPFVAAFGPACIPLGLCSGCTLACSGGQQ